MNINTFMKAALVMLLLVSSKANAWEPKGPVTDMGAGKQLRYTQELYPERGDSIEGIAKRFLGSAAGREYIGRVHGGNADAAFATVVATNLSLNRDKFTAVTFNGTEVSIPSSAAALRLDPLRPYRLVVAPEGISKKTAAPQRQQAKQSAKPPRKVVSRSRPAPKPVRHFDPL
jgi:hypothetical protein